MEKIFVSELFKKYDDWYDYYANFYNYKICNQIPDNFGRDAALTTANLFHIHIANNDIIEDKWSSIKNMYERTTEKDNPEEDFWLIYAHDQRNKEYLLLAIVGPDAHSYKNWNPLYSHLAATIVDPWIRGMIEYTEPDESEDI